MAIKRNENALYWQLLRQHRAYVIRGYLAQHGTVSAAAAALGVHRSVIDRDIDILRNYGLMDSKKPRKGVDVEHELENRPGDGDPDDDVDSVDDADDRDSSTDEDSPVDHEPEPSL